MQLTYAERKILEETLRIIGRNINNIRVRRNFTLKKISRRTGFKVETIDKFELGRTIIHIPDLLKIATALETPIEKLIKP